MDEQPAPSMIVRIFGPILMMAMALGAFTFFLFEARSLSLDQDSTVLVLDKGIFHFLGGGFVLFLISVVLVQEYWFRKSLSQKQNLLFSRCVLFGLLLTLLLPFFAGPLIALSWEKEGYLVCKIASKQGFPYSQVVYVSEAAQCKAELRGASPHISSAH